METFEFLFNQLRKFSSSLWMRGARVGQTVPAPHHAKDPGRLGEMSLPKENPVDPVHPV